MEGFGYSIASGILAATASVFGKLAMSSDDLDFLMSTITLKATNAGSFTFLAIRLLMFPLMILMNAIMWTTFTKAVMLFQSVALCNKF